MTKGFPDPGGQEQAEVAVNRLPRRKGRGRRQVAPLATGPHDVEQAVQHLPHVGRPGPPTGFCRRDERLDHAVLVIAQGLTSAEITDPGTFLGRPHRCLRKKGNTSLLTAAVQPLSPPLTLARKG